MSKLPLGDAVGAGLICAMYSTPVSFLLHGAVPRVAEDRPVSYLWWALICVAMAVWAIWTVALVNDACKCATGHRRVLCLIITALPGIAVLLLGVAIGVERI